MLYIPVTSSQSIWIGITSGVKDVWVNFGGDEATYLP